MDAVREGSSGLSTVQSALSATYVGFRSVMAS